MRGEDGCAHGPRSARSYRSPLTSTVPGPVVHGRTFDRRRVVGDPGQVPHAVDGGDQPGPQTVAVEDHEAASTSPAGASRNRVSPATVTAADAPPAASATSSTRT